ncbi:MAG: DotG/IcmE/VirB10 family protein [Deltaproteobacteria bacterium]|jgi:type IV secretory pathway VirB10-like protein|nr:DotG/IcmE/VirB10 family protein [Deltaproteobacteria bacterium]
MNLFSNARPVPRKYAVMAILAALLALIVAFGVFLVAKRNATGASDIKGLARQKIETSVGGEGTPEYNRLVDSQNYQKSQEARLLGDSFVATPTGAKARLSEPPASPLVKGQASAPERSVTPPPLINPPPTARVREKPQSAKAPFDNRGILAELKLASASLSQGSGPVISYTGVSFAPAKESASADPKGAALQGFSLNPGTILFAVTAIALNSDIPSPVLATVAQGELKGAKAIGDFKTFENGVVLSFNKLITPAGTEIAIDAVAIDPATSQASVRSRVDSHFWQRWGSLIAASFIEGFGEAARTRHTRVYSTDSRVIEDSFGKTYRDVSAEALGKVGQRSANQVEKGFDRPPTITVRLGESIGILILSVGN